MLLSVDIPSRVYALVDCNCFYVSCERIFKPSLQNRPVIVLSNNDGCAVSISAEAKALGIVIGTPLFKIADLVLKHDIAVFSSNYSLYGDISLRVMETLEEFSPEIEVYSIDESFLSLKGMREDYERYGRRIKETVRMHTGIPVSVGIGPTKTLAKAANRLTKKYAYYGGVLNLCGEQDMDRFLQLIPIKDVWGIGRRYTKKLLNHGIENAAQLKNLSNDWVVKYLGGVVGLRLVEELRGNSCLSLEQITPPKKEIMRGRTFGKPVTTLRELEEAVSTHAVRAAEKLRQQKSHASMVHVFISTNRHKTTDRQYHNFAGLRLNYQTDFSPDIARSAIRALRLIYRPGFRYKRAGVMLSGLVPENEMQLNLFLPAPSKKRKCLMKAVDEINNRWRRDMVQVASNGIKPAWRMKRELLSKCYTTNWDELLEVRI